MKIFIDTANLKEIKEVEELGILDGVTTNPSLITKETHDREKIFEIYKEICKVCKNKPVSLEVSSLDYEEMLKEAYELVKIADNVCIKLPITENGIKCCKVLSNNAIKVNMTLCFTPSQALLCAKAGATFVSPFVGRMFDAAEDGIELVRKIKEIYSIYDFRTQVLSASIRNIEQVEKVALVGSDVATIPYKIIKEMFKHKKTDEGIAKFVKDYSEVK